MFYEALLTKNIDAENLMRAESYSLSTNPCREFIYVDDFIEAIRDAEYVAGIAPERASFWASCLAS